VYPGLFLHLLDIYAHEVAVSNNRVITFCMCGGPPYCPSAEGLSHGYFQIFRRNKLDIYVACCCVTCI
jgi:hypothetical protein